MLWKAEDAGTAWYVGERPQSTSTARGFLGFLRAISWYYERIRSSAKTEPIDRSRNTHKDV